MNIEKVKEMQKVHYDSTTPMDDYHAGFYNGIEYALCILENKEPDYFSVEKPSNEKRVLEAKIMGLQEAMRPLLEDWSKLK